MWRKSLKNTAIQLGGKVVTVVMAIATTALLTRNLGITGYGGFTLIVSIVLLIDALADLGTGVIGVREASKNEGKEEEIYCNLAVLRLLLGGVAVMVGVVIVELYPGLAGLKVEMVLGLAISLVGGAVGSAGVVFQTRLRWGWKTAAEVVYPMVFLGILVVLGNQLSLGLVMGAYLVARIISLGVAILGIKFSIFNFQFSKPNWIMIKKLLVEAWPMGVYLLVFTSYDKGVDSVMINSLAGRDQVAWYGLAYKIFSNLTMPAFFLVNSIFPLMVRSGAGEMVVRARRWLLVGSIAVVGVAEAGAVVVVGIIAGSGFGVAAGVLRILVLALPFSYLNHLWGFFLISGNGQRKMLKLGLVALVFNVVANWVVIPRAGMWGAAWVTVATEGLMWVMLQRFKSLKSKV